MADRIVATTNTLNYFRHEFNGSAEDIGTIADLLSASGYIASSTDVVEAIVAINTELPEITTDAFVFPTGTMTFEGATDDAYETVLSMTDPTADRTYTFPNANGDVVLVTHTQTWTNKTLTTPTITSGVLNTALSGSAFLDEDDLSSNSATKLASQQSIKAYIDSQTTAQDLDIAPDSGSAQAIDLDSETLTFSGGTEIGTTASGNTVTMNITSAITTLTGSQTLTNKTFTSPTINTMTFASGTATSGMIIGGTGIVFEGSSADAYETTLTVAEPTADRVITIPNSTMTLITTATHANKSNHISKCIALG